MSEPLSSDLQLLDRLRAKFPGYKIISAPDPECGCKGAGERKAPPSKVWPNGREVPCLCVCLSGVGRAAAVRIVGNAAKKIRQEEFGNG